MTALAAILLLSLYTAAVHADDGGIAFGGSPRLLNGHPSVSMQSEVVQMIVGKDTLHVDCQFVFRNDGPACKVRMGFPDSGRSAMDPEEEGPQKHPTGTFTSYTSYVDGVKVPTQTIHGAQEGDFWHAKVVNFPAHATRHVHDVYTVPVGGGIVYDGKGSIQQAYYILHTGASWHGSIGRAEVDVTFAPGTIPTPLILTPLSAAPDNNADKYAWPKNPHGTVLYRGPSRPTLQGRTLRFVRTNLKPGYLDDVLLSFGYHGIGAQ
jgi:hypothetical protein